MTIGQYLETETFDNDIKKTAWNSNKEFYSQFGVLIQGINIEKMGKNLAIFTVVIRIIRKLIFIASIIVFINYPTFTIICFNFIIISSLTFDDWNHVQKDIWEQRKLIMDEYLLLLINYHLFCFTDWIEIEG